MLNKIVRWLMCEMTFFGGLPFFLLVIALFYLLGEESTALTFSLGLILLHLTTITIRLFYFKRRPKRMPYRNIAEKINASSFPSLHTGRAFFTSFVLLSLDLVVGLLFLMIAVIVGLSRLYLRKHYLIDVIGGAVMGIVLAILLP